jgi:hypothetical protein
MYNVVQGTYIINCKRRKRAKKQFWKDFKFSFLVDFVIGANLKSAQKLQICYLLIFLFKIDKLDITGSTGSIVGKHKCQELCTIV